MQAIIRAAGMGKRLQELTQNNTKCMVKVNGTTLIDRMLHQIEALSLNRIIIVVGYEGQKLINYIQTLDIHTPIHFIDNPIYDKTNNIYSLSLAKDLLLEDDTLLFESDLIFEDSVLSALVEDPRETLALVDKYQCWMDGACVKIGEDDTISDFIPGNQFRFEDCEEYYKTVNIYKFSRHFSEAFYVPFLVAYQQALGVNEYYEQVLRIITILDDPQIHAKKLTGQLWYEIDDIQDLDIAETIFSSSASEKASLLAARFGGYWRYPSLIDFCYLVNPYYPPRKLMDELMASFEKLVTQYPSGMRIISLLAARNFNLSQNQVAVGNGAAELIKSLMGQLEGTFGVIRPTFEEYPNRLDPEKTVCYRTNPPDFRYSAKDLIGFFSEHPVRNLVLINPDNPTGNYIPHADLLALAAWAEESGVRLILDESFADFSDEADSSFLIRNFLDQHPSLIVVKSISKSYGVPGLRLGILASGDTSLISAIKKDVSIWNINSFAEFYLQISQKYQKDYRQALALFRKERSRFLRKLKTIEGIRILPTQANYVTVELLSGVSSAHVCSELVAKHNILIKDLSGKMNQPGRQYLRIAIKSKEENNLLCDALSSVLQAPAS